MTGRVCVLGVFAVDAVFRGPVLPRPGETVLGTAFAMGPGGKGSNQAVAAVRAGAPTAFISRVGRDGFAEIGRALWRSEGIEDHVAACDLPTGSAGIFVDASTGENAIMVCAGAAGSLSADDADRAAPVIAQSSVLVTQLEQPLAAARRGLEIARSHGVVTVLNPAPAMPLDDALIATCDWIIPNLGEAAALVGHPAAGPDTARRAAEALLARGAGGVIVTLGSAGALLVSGGRAIAIPAFAPATVVDTTGAGDVFTGSFAAALAGNADAVTAACFASAAAGLSVGRAGAAVSAPRHDEIVAHRDAGPPHGAGMP